MTTPSHNGEHMAPATASTSHVSQAIRVVATALLGFAIGFVVRGCLFTSPPPSMTLSKPASSKKNEVWTCSMHPQIRQARPGRCPLCGMDLIPVSSGESSGGQIAMSPLAQKLADIRLAPVERRFPEVNIRMSGKVGLDETRVAYITTRVGGRIDRLYVNFVGAPVKKGDHLADIYSPDLLAAQQELLQAATAVRDAEASGSALRREGALATLAATREKLRLWQLTDAQIEEIERSGKISPHLTFYSPLSGIVVARMETFEGMYIETGMKLFTVADLSRVWIKLDAYESDIAWLRYGQPVTFQVEAYPGEEFRGTIAFIDPLVDTMTRTVKVRVNAVNTDGRLKPEMFVRAVVGVKATETGKVIIPNLAGKWISPMHPEIVKDGPGTCDVCGMPLVPAEDLGYASRTPTISEAPLVIPATAPLITGERAVVYVAAPGQEGVFDGREVVLGPKAGEWYLVRSGLQEGEMVVVNGNFKIDSALQIQGRKSLMHDPHANLATPSAAPAETPLAGKPQTHCPVMGGNISRKLYADYEGQRIYFCCPGCKETFWQEPQKYLEKMRAEGIQPEPVPTETKKANASQRSEHAH